MTHEIESLVTFIIGLQERTYHLITNSELVVKQLISNHDWSVYPAAFEQA